MPRFAQIDTNGVCYAQSDTYGVISGPGIVQVGDDEEVLGKAHVNGKWVEPDLKPAAVPESISDRQFAQQLAILGHITEPEAIAWAAKGDLPALVTAAVNDLPDDGTRFAAEMMLSSATTYERHHPMTALLGEKLFYEPKDLDALWRAASLL